MARCEISNEDLRERCGLLFETLRQHRKVLESSMPPEAKLNLVSNSFERLYSRTKDFCDSLTEYSVELELIVSGEYRPRGMVTGV